LPNEAQIVIATPGRGVASFLAHSGVLCCRAANPTLTAPTGYQPDARWKQEASKEAAMTNVDMDAIRRLSVPDRVRLAQDIWDSLRPTANELPLTAEQAALIDERLEEHERDPDSAVPWPDVKSRPESL
jgi:putative addiction module component (TIGR02574 family)